MNARNVSAIAGVVTLLATSLGAPAMSLKDYASTVTDRGGLRVQRLVTNTDAYRHAAAGRLEVARCIVRTFTAPPDGGAAAPSEAMAALIAELDKEKDRSDRSVEAVVLHTVVAKCPSTRTPAVPGPADLKSDWTPVGVFQKYTEVEKRFAVSLASSTQAVRLLVEGRKKAARCIAKRFVVHAGQADPRGLTKLLRSMDPDASVERNIVEALAAACGRAVADVTAPK